MAVLSEILRSGEGDALLWFCPGCQCAHQIHVGSGPGPRWTWNGNVEKPTFSPSVKVKLGKWEKGPDQICHCFIGAGMIEFLGDCTHDLAGKVVPIPPFHPDDD